MVAGKQTVFLMSETSRDLVKSANLESTHIMHSKLALFAGASLVGLILAATRHV
jgi:hypothetical protein